MPVFKKVNIKDRNINSWFQANISYIQAYLSAD